MYVVKSHIAISSGIRECESNMTHLTYLAHIANPSHGMGGLRVLEKGIITFVAHATSLVDFGNYHPRVYSIHTNTILGLLI